MFLIPPKTAATERFDIGGWLFACMTPAITDPMNPPCGALPDDDPNFQNLLREESSQRKALQDALRSIHRMQGAIQQTNDGLCQQWFTFSNQSLALRYNVQILFPTQWSDTAWIDSIYWNNATSRWYFSG